MHPQECEEMIRVWDGKQKRERLRDASLQHIIALAGGMKKQGGGKLTIFDFAPDLKQEQTPEQKEAVLKSRLIAMAAKSNKKK